MRAMMFPMKEPGAQRSEKMRESLLSAIDLMEFGIRLMRQNISRALPDASKEQVDIELRRWLFEQPADFQPQIPLAGTEK